MTTRPDDSSEKVPESTKAPSRPKLRPDPSVIVASEVPTEATLTPTPNAVDAPIHSAPARPEPTLPVTAPTPAWEIDPEERIAGEPLPASATSPPSAPTTQPTPVWSHSPRPDAMVTETTPAWNEDGKSPAAQANVVTAAMPAWNDDAAKPSGDLGPHANIITDETPAWRDGVEPTRKKLAQVPVATDATRLKLDPVAEEVPPGATRRTTPPAGTLPRGVKLGLAAFITLSLVLLAWAFGRSDDVLDPSRPEMIRTIKTTAVPLPPEKKVDVTPVIAAPKEPPKPAVAMELVVDGGDGSSTTTHVQGSIVRIETEPPTNVFWNGNDFGWTPALITMPVGPNTVTLENKDVGFKRTMSITAANEERTFLRFEFSKGWLSIDRPRTAKAVLVDGVKMMQSPVLVWEGKHRIEVVFANGQKGSKLAEVVRGETVELFFDDPLPQE